jgi:hypothetical protein
MTSTKKVFGIKKWKFKNETAVTNKDDILLSWYNRNRNRNIGHHCGAIIKPGNELDLVNVTEHMPRVGISDLLGKVPLNLIWKAELILLSLSSWSRVVIEKLTVTHLVNKFPVFYGNRRFITVFTRARHCWPHPQPDAPNPHLPTVFLILSSHLRLGPPSYLFPSGFATKILYAFLISSMDATCRCPSHRPWFGQPSNIMWRVHVMKLLIMKLGQ